MASLSDSVTGKVEAAKSAATGYEVPDNLPKLTKEEQGVWNQYTQAKTRWKAADLRSLHALVKHETKLAKLIKRPDL